MDTYNICFFGITGYGKSSLINKLFGSHFNTDPLVSCTKELYSVTTIENINGIDKAITVFDTPGIGEFSSNDRYEKLYQIAARQADHIVLVVTFDRIDRPSQDLLDNIRFFVKDGNVKFTIVLNKIDITGVTDKEKTYHPWNDTTNSPSEECFSRIDERIKTINAHFGNPDEFSFLPYKIVPVCAMRDFGIKELKETLLNCNND